MNSKWASTGCLIVLVMGMFLTSTRSLYAAENRPIIDGS